jgi:hypothetical protein
VLALHNEPFLKSPIKSFLFDAKYYFIDNSINEKYGIILNSAE